VKSAVVHYKNTVNNETTEVHLCESCAKDKENNLILGINELMSGFLVMKPQNNRQMLQCDFCGRTQNDISNIGKAGCANCYTVFREYLVPIIRRIHGTDTHTGKRPRNVSSPESHESKADNSTANTTLQNPEIDSNASKLDANASEVEALEKSMRQAILDENYEEAAKLRDQIAKLKDEITKLKEGGQ